MTQVKDLQFPKYFLTHEMDINPSLAAQLLNIKVMIRNDGEPDKSILRDNTLIINQPSSMTRFLFQVLYTIIKNHVNSGFHQDKLGLGLLYACKDYTYSDYKTYEHKIETPPILLSFEKLIVPTMIIETLIEPLVGKIESRRVMFIKSNFVDACEVAYSSEKLSKRFCCPFKSVSFHDYPFFVINSKVHNNAAQMAHLTYKAVEHTFGSEKTQRVIKNLILGDNHNLAANLVEILKILEGDPMYIMDFLKFFKSNVTLTIDEENRASKMHQQIIESDTYLNKKIKVAQQGKYTPQVFKQWHQWSMIMGLIEKQLAPMRGSMWPASENIKPIEDAHRQLMVEMAKEKGKSQLNFEELLELSREWYGHKAVQPGQLAENLLKENRIWKV